MTDTHHSPHRPLHIFFSGIGGTGLGPLALIAAQAGYQVSGSDKQDSDYIAYLKKNGLSDIHIGQTEAAIAAVHESQPIDWFVYSSALPKENPEHPELLFVQQNNIRSSKRDELLVEIINQKELKLIAIAGTHGKTTTTAMMIWMFKQLGLPISYSVGAKISFGEMGTYQPGSEYFVYECDEYDRNFLSFHPFASIISGIAYDHADIYPTQTDYNQAFRDFIGQSRHTIIYGEDAERLELTASESVHILDASNPAIDALKLPGRVNRLDAWQVMHIAQKLFNSDEQQLAEIMNRFPGVSRRFEQLAPNIYSDYAHTPEKIRGAIGVALETNPNVVVVYEGLHNRRQHFIKDSFGELFRGAKQLYWVPSYLAREDPNLPLLSPAELITMVGESVPAEPAELNERLLEAIINHAHNGDLVLCLSAGGGGSLDEWLRRNVSDHA